MDSFDEYMERDESRNDDELLEAAISNTYEYLVSDLEREELPAGTWMLRRPRRVATIDQLIEYFTGTEEYEKCAELVKIKHTIN
tara:strand:- start:21 stop:272 length:252 start_codon:yes stop_codon:yes gene_type:complete